MLHLNHLLLLFLTIGPCLTYGSLQIETRKRWIRLPIPIPRPPPATAPVTPNVCPTVTMGCTTAGAGTCAGNPLMCTVPDATPTNCHWPAVSTGCTADTANNPVLGDCACDGSTVVLPNCPTITGCTTAQCAGATNCPVGVDPATRALCYWPDGAAPTTCMKDLTTTMDCGCDN